MSDSLAVELSQDEIRSGMLPETTAFLGQSDDYTAISANVRELVESGHHEALYVPAVKFIIDSTLGIVTQPQVEPRLPKAVTARSQVAIHFANYVVDVGLRGDIFMHYYTHNTDLRDAPMAKREIIHLSDPDDETGYLASIGGAPFYDTALVSGGALNFLKEQHITESPADIIKRSSGLLAISGVYKGLSTVAFDYLGSPYALPKHFRLVPEAEETKLAFSEETAAMLRRLQVSDRGCPSGRIAYSEKSDTTILQHAWHQLVDYLVPSDATAEVTNV